MLLLREGQRAPQMAHEKPLPITSPLVRRSYPLAAEPTGRREAGKSSQAGRAVCNRHGQCMLPVRKCARCCARRPMCSGPALRMPVLRAAGISLVCG
jgi:hypothetical protein